MPGKKTQKKKVKFANGKGTNNKAKNIISSDKSKKQKKLVKLQEHIVYCKKLEKAYNQKHEEVRALTDYLREIAATDPGKPISETDIIKIIDYIGDIKVPQDVVEKEKRLKKLIDIQEGWKEEIRRIKPEIDKKLNNLKGTRKEVKRIEHITHKLGNR